MSDEAPQNRGSMLGGFFVTWAIVVAGAFLGLVLLQDASGLLFAPVAWLVGIIMAATSGHSRFAIGMLLGFASIAAIGVLLMAACFGMLSHTNFN